MCIENNHGWTSLSNAIYAPNNCHLSLSGIWTFLEPFLVIILDSLWWRELHSHLHCKGVMGCQPACVPPRPPQEERITDPLSRFTRNCTLIYIVKCNGLSTTLCSIRELLIHCLLIYCVHSYMSSTVTTLYEILLAFKKPLPPSITDLFSFWQSFFESIGFRNTQ